MVDWLEKPKKSLIWMIKMVLSSYFGKCWRVLMHICWRLHRCLCFLKKKNVSRFTHLYFARSAAVSCCVYLSLPVWCMCYSAVEAFSPLKGVNQISLWRYSRVSCVCVTPLRRYFLYQLKKHVKLLAVGLIAVTDYYPSTLLEEEQREFFKRKTGRSTLCDESKMDGGEKHLATEAFESH